MHACLAKFLVPVLLAGPTLLPQEGPKVSRIYKADETGGIALTIKAIVGGTDIDASATIAYKISKLLEGGKAQARFEMKDLKVNMGGSDMPVEVEPVDATVDSFGLPDTLPFNQVETLYSIAALCSIAPQSTAKAGESFDFKWTNDKKTASIKGKGKFLESADVEGLKTAKYELDIEVSSGQDETSITVRLTSWLDVANGKMVKADGRLSVPDGTEVEFKAKQAK